MLIHDENGGKHVVPIDDIFPHIESRKCVCKPERKEHALVVHNSFDGREAYEPERLFG